MLELVLTLKTCLKFAKDNECEVHYDKSCVTKTQLRQKLEDCVKFIEDNYREHLTLKEEN